MPFVKGYIPWNKGKKHSKATKRKMRQKHLGMKKPWAGKYLKSKEHIEKIRQLHLGIKASEKTKEKMRQARLGKYDGENNPNWQGGISFEPYSADWTKTLRRNIRERNYYICQVCGQYGNIVHHIDYDKQNCSPDNLITLCIKCHMKTNHKRDYWKYFFKNQEKIQ